MNKKQEHRGLSLEWPSLIVLVRHGESEGNRYGRQHMAQVLKKPSYKFALTERGREQAMATREYLAGKYGLKGFDAHFTSTYSRAQETFDCIFGQPDGGGAGIRPIIDARINEITRGYASIIGEEELFAMHPKEVETLKLNGWFHNIPLCGQSCVQVDHVIQTFLAYLREACKGKRVVIVGHGTWINLCCRILCNRTPEESEELHRAGFYKNASVTVFAPDESGQLQLVDENVVPWEGKVDMSEPKAKMTGSY